jgi:hypothetical protein
MTAATLDLTALNAALKELYTDQVVRNLTYKNNPLLAMLKKNTDFGGKSKPIPVIYGSPLGSNTFANAQSNATTLNVESFALTLTRDYVVAYIDNLTMLSAKSDKMSFINAAKGTIDGAIRTASNRLAGSLFRSGTGMIGTLSGITTGVISLTNAADVVNFEVGMVLNAYDDAVGTNQSTSNAKGYVIAVNRGPTPTVTVSASAGGSAGTPSNWSTSFPYLCIDGDLNVKLKGLAAWVPTSAPTSATFFGVNRAKDATRLGGVRFDGSAMPIEEALIDGSSLIAREGGTPSMCFVSFATFAALEKSLGAKVQYCDLKSDAGIGFKGIKVHGANSVIDVVADRSCPAGLAYLLDMDTWALESAGDAPMILNQIDGLDMLRVYNADAAEIRVGSYAQLACNAPGWNGVIQTAV